MATQHFMKGNKFVNKAQLSDELFRSFDLNINNFTHMMNASQKPEVTSLRKAKVYHHTDERFRLLLKITDA